LPGAVACHPGRAARAVLSQGKEGRVVTTAGNAQRPRTASASICLMELAGQRAYLPIAAAYLKAYATKDDAIRRQARISLVIEQCEIPAAELLRRTVADGIPDMVGISCQGWSLPAADILAKKLRKLNPGLLVVYGGNHVSHQGERFFAKRPFADILVNGEGEVTFSELLSRYLAGARAVDLADVAGISYRRPDGTVVINQDRARMENLDDIPSPYLSGILDDFLGSCETALLETNRGCPYRCSYCYWGQATGQRLHAFSVGRLREEMRFLAERGVDSWYICDANFGILREDAEIVDEIVRLRKLCGYPKTVHTNWAKNSNQRIVELCAKLNEGGVHSTYSLALQSTTEPALRLANRANMKINKIGEIAQLCRSHGVVPRGELIWGLPGEDYDGFLRSYDSLARHADALSVYPLYVLPNTQYAHDAEQLGIVTRRAEQETDYEYCVQHEQMTYEQFLTGLRFIISNNILKVGSAFFRLYPRVANSVAGIPFHQTIEVLARWIMETDHPQAQRFRRYYDDPITLHRQSLTEVWIAIRRDWDGLLDMFCSYVEYAIHRTVDDADQLTILRQALRYDAETYPVVDTRSRENGAADGFYRHTVRFGYDFLGMQRGETDYPAEGEVTYLIEHPAGLWRYPMENWYFGLIGYQGRVIPASAGPLVTGSSPASHPAATSATTADRRTHPVQ
jgi:radical SAM C-methyltransferase